MAPPFPATGCHYKTLRFSLAGKAQCHYYSLRRSIGNMKNHKLLLWSLTVALSGFLFGLDTAVISGAEQTIQKLWNLDNITHGLAVSMALYGTVVGAAFGGFFADGLGRKKSLFWVGALFLISSLGSALSQGVYLFMVFRLLGGLCIGASSVVSPLYISEIAPPAKRVFWSLCSNSTLSSAS